MSAELRSNLKIPADRLDAINKVLLTDDMQVIDDFLAVVETGRFKYFRDGHDEEGSDAWWFFTQAEHCGYELREGLPIERGLRWEVRATAKVIFSDGASHLVHDDRLLSAALVAELDRLVREGTVFVGTGESAVIRRAESGERGAWA